MAITLNAFDRGKRRLKVYIKLMVLFYFVTIFAIVSFLHHYDNKNGMVMVVVYISSCIHPGKHYQFENGHGFDCFVSCILDTRLH